MGCGSPNPVHDYYYDYDYDYIVNIIITIIISNIVIIIIMNIVESHAGWDQVLAHLMGTCTSGFRRCLFRKVPWALLAS